MMLSLLERDFLRHTKKRGTKEELLAFYGAKRKEGFPHVYISGRMSFHDLELFVDESCLIPRMETELFVERALLRLKEKGSILDLCAGSGAIGLSVKSLRPSLEVTLSDISGEALKIARKNALHNKLDVEMVEGDFLDPFLSRKFSAILCNPPYVSIDEYHHLEREVKDHEPKQALTDGGDGYFFYQELSSKVYDMLEPSGIVALEIGKDQALRVLQMFPKELWKKEVEKDYAGHDRFLFLEKRG